jgi:hypothetical protein
MIATMPAANAAARAPRLNALRALALAAMSAALWAPRTLAAAEQQAPAQPPAVPAGGQSNPDPKSIEIPGPIKAEPPEVNFGIVEPGTKVSANIKLINPLDEDVMIIAAKPSCTCTTVDMVGKVIPARGSIEVPMAMKTSHTPGTKTAVVNMAFKGITQVMVLKIQAETAYAVRAAPNFIDALAPERMQGTFELVSADGTPFTVKSVDGRPPVSADGSPMKAATMHTLRYDFTKPSPLCGTFLAVPPFLIVETDHPKCPILDMRVRHATTRITPAFGFAEFRANCGAMSAKGSSEFELEIKLMRKMRIGSVQSLLPAFQTQLVSQTPDGESVLVKVRVTDLGAQPGPFLFPCRFTGNGKTSDFWLFGTIR